MVIMGNIFLVNTTCYTSYKQISTTDDEYKTFKKS